MVGKPINQGSMSVGCSHDAAVARIFP